MTWHRILALNLISTSVAFGQLSSPSSTGASTTPSQPVPSAATGIPVNPSILPSIPGLTTGGSLSIPGLVPQPSQQRGQSPAMGAPGSLGPLSPLPMNSGAGAQLPGLSPFSNSPFSNPSQQSAVPQKEYKAPPVVTYDPKNALQVKPLVVVKTSEGQFKLRLDPNLAPRNVENFVELALGRKEFVDSQTSKKVKRPFYTGLLCHKIVKNVLIQCGCPFGNGRGGPGYFINDELSEQSRLDREGLIAMAPINTKPNGQKDYQSNSNGSQFFITLGPWPEPEEKFTVIGSVVEGMSVIRKISKIPVGPTDRPLKRVIIFSIDVENMPQTNPAGAPTELLGTPDPGAAAPNDPMAPIDDSGDPMSEGIR